METYRNNLMTTDDASIGPSFGDYQQRGNATASNISPQQLYANNPMGGYMDSIMSGIMGSSPFMRGVEMPQRPTDPYAPEQPLQQPVAPAPAPAPSLMEYQRPKFENKEDYSKFALMNQGGLSEHDTRLFNQQKAYPDSNRGLDLG